MAPSFSFHIPRSRNEVLCAVDLLTLLSMGDKTQILSRQHPDVQYLIKKHLFTIFESQFGLRYNDDCVWSTIAPLELKEKLQVRARTTTCGESAGVVFVCSCLTSSGSGE